MALRLGLTIDLVIDMSDEIKSIIEKVLTLIGYEDDKDAFINEFMNLCMQKSLVDYKNVLPEARKKELHQILQGSDPTIVKEQIGPYIKTEEFVQLFTKNIQEFLQDYFQTIMPTLSLEQKNGLDTYFTSLKAGQ